MFVNSEGFIDGLEHQFIKQKLYSKQNAAPSLAASFWETMDTNLTNSFDLKKQGKDKELVLVPALPNRKLATVFHNFDPQELANYKSDKEQLKAI